MRCKIRLGRVRVLKKLPYDFKNVDLQSNRLDSFYIYKSIFCDSSTSPMRPSIVIKLEIRSSAEVRNGRLHKNVYISLSQIIAWKCNLSLLVLKHERRMPIDDTDNILINRWC